MNGGIAGGSSLRPVLLGELFTGLAGSKSGPAFSVAKSHFAYALLNPTKYGQPKLPGFLAWLNSSYPLGPLVESCPASGPISPQYTTEVTGFTAILYGFLVPITYISGRVFSVPFGKRFPSGTVYVPSGSGCIRKIFPFRSFVFEALLCASMLRCSLPGRSSIGA